jgi:hypothetical protein
MRCPIEVFVIIIVVTSVRFRIVLQLGGTAQRTTQFLGESVAEFRAQESPDANHLAATGERDQ